jgi:hypothetical protein
MIIKGILQDLLLKKQILLVEAVSKNRIKIITMTYKIKAVKKRVQAVLPKIYK